MGLFGVQIEDGTITLSNLDGSLQALLVDQGGASQAASIANISATYDSTGGVASRGRFINAPNALDSLPLKVGYRLLLKNQTAKDQNGLWEVLVVGTGADGVWERSSNFDADAKVSNGAFTIVTGGVTHAVSLWVLVTQDPITVGGTSGSDLVWTELAGGGGGGPGGTNTVVRTYFGSPAVNDVIYQRTDGRAGLADASDIATSEAVLGFVAAVDSPIPGQVTIQYNGDLGGFSGLTIGATYILSTIPGKVLELGDILSPAYPDQTPGSGHIVREVGNAASATVMFVEVGRDLMES